MNSDACAYRKQPDEMDGHQQRPLGSEERCFRPRIRQLPGQRRRRVIGRHCDRPAPWKWRLLARARHKTHIYGADTRDRAAEVDRLQELAERINRTEPELPPIQTPLAHEATVAAALQTTT
jgi:hypothetical protein